MRLASCDPLPLSGREIMCGVMTLFALRPRCESRLVAIDHFSVGFKAR